MIKKKFIALLLAAATLLPLSAQQLPNPGFEDKWVDCTPWTSSNNDKTEGKTPSPWTISHTVGISGLGATSVGEETTGYNNTGSAVLIHNQPNIFMSSQIIPGYLTLGTTWSTAVGTSAKNKDGGTFNGYNFPFRPDAISFMFKVNGGKSASAVVYLWKGTYSQASVPANIVLNGSPKTETMIDRERNILGRETEQGGEVTKTDGAELIAVYDCDYANTPLADISNTWTSVEIPLEYKSAATPEKINVIFSAGDYFNNKPEKGDNLSVDDVKLLYYSRLESVKFGDYEVPQFDSKNYDYTVHTDFPSVDDVIYKLLGQSGMAKADVTADEDTQTITITVTNALENTSAADYGDYDNKNTHTYVFHFPTYTDKTADIKVEYTHDCIGGSILLNYVYTVHNYYGDEDPEMTITLHRDNEDITDILTWWIMQEKAPLKKITRDEGKLVCDGKLAYVGDALKYNSADEAIKNPVTARLSAKLGDLTLVDGHEIELNDPGTVTGIENVAADAADAPVEYFNMQGMRIERPMPGTPAIRRQGSRVEKIIMK